MNCIASIDTSSAGWDDITGNEPKSEFDGTWEFVDCPDEFLTDKTRIRIKYGSSEWWQAIQAQIQISNIISKNCKTEHSLQESQNNLWLKL